MMKNKKTLSEWVKSWIGLTVAGALLLCSLSGCSQNKEEKTSESVTTGQVQNQSETVTEEPETEKLLENVAGSYYGDRTDVKDIYGELEPALGDSRIMEINTVSDMKLVLALTGKEDLYIAIYDMVSGELSEKLSVGGPDTMYYLYKDKYIVCMDYAESESMLAVYDMELNIIIQHAFPPCSDEELENQTDGGLYTTDSSWFYNPETDMLFYSSGYGDIYGYSFADGSYTNYDKTENAEWGGVDFVKESCTDKTLVYSVYGDYGDHTKIMDIASKKIEDVYGEVRYSIDKNDDSRNALICYGQDYKIHSNTVNAAFDYTIEYETAEMDWKNDTVFTYLKSEEMTENEIPESFSCAYRAYDMNTGALYASLNLGSFDAMEYIESINSHYRQGGLDVCGDVAVIRIMNGLGEICNVLVWDYQQGILEDTTEYADKLISINHEYEDMSNSEIKSMLEEKYQIEIYYGEDTDNLQINDIYMTALYDENYMHGVFVNLAEALELFPDNLFSQFHYDGTEQKLRIYLCKEVNIQDNGIEEVGVHTVSDDASVVAVNVQNSFKLYHDNVLENNLKTTIVHELFHAITEYLEIDFDMWFAENPEDFDYYQDAAGYDEHEDSLKYTALDENEEIYFVNSYSKVNIYEEIAVLYEYSLFNDTNHTAEKILESEHITNKIKMFNSWIRDSYDTTGWPQKTVWEELVE